MTSFKFLCRRLPLFAGLAGIIVVAGCSTPQTGYGSASQQSNDDAIMRQQIANQDPVADKRGMYLSMIQEMQSNGLYFASLAHVDAFEQKYGAAPDVELLRAHGLREAGQSTESEAVYRKLLSTASGAAAAQGLGLLAGARGDYGAAVASLRDAARRDPTNPLIVSDLGYALLRHGDIAAARLSIAQAAELAPANPKIIGNLALFLLVSGDTARADAVMNRANLTPDMRNAVRRLAGDIAKRSPGARSATPSPRTAATVVAESSATRDMSRIPESAAAAPRDLAAIDSVQSSGATVAKSAFNPTPMQSLFDRFGGNSP